MGFFSRSEPTPAPEPVAPAPAQAPVEPVLPVRDDGLDHTVFPMPQELQNPWRAMKRHEES